MPLPPSEPPPPSDPGDLAGRGFCPECAELECDDDCPLAPARHPPPSTPTPPADGPGHPTPIHPPSHGLHSHRTP